MMMKNLMVLLTAFVCLLFACTSNTSIPGSETMFGIHEIISLNELPDSLINDLESANIVFGKEQDSPFIGYLHKDDSDEFLKRSYTEKIKMLKTKYAIDKENRYYGIMAVKAVPVIDNSHIKKTKPEENRIEIFFNRPGAGKWAGMTKTNTGKIVAFVIDDEIYSVPFIQGEIKNGRARINELRTPEEAEQLSAKLNSHVSE